MERITAYLENDVQPSANGVAIFACDAAELFETVQIDAPLDDHWLYVGDQPHLYPLARVASQYPRYAVVLADTNRTRILVIADGGVTGDTAIEGQKTRRTTQGGWSQARYQRHVENYHLHHIKDVVATLEKIVLQEGIDRVIVSGDPVVIPSGAGAAVESAGRRRSSTSCRFRRTRPRRRSSPRLARRWSRRMPGPIARRWMPRSAPIARAVSASSVPTPPCWRSPTARLTSCC